jgi:hypothetical protein
MDDSALYLDASTGAMTRGLPCCALAIAEKESGAGCVFHGIEMQHGLPDQVLSLRVIAGLDPAIHAAAQHGPPGQARW